jgi:GntR family phosphonate transport system transcriptional regulator
MQRGGGVALWRQIEQQLLDEIAGGALKPGDRLATEAALAQRFGVNRHTVRRAIGALVQRGIVEVTQGRGTFIHTDVIDYALGKRTRFSENLLRQQRVPSGRLLQTTERAATAAIAQALGLAPGTAVLMVESLGEADGLPISHSQSFFPADRFRALPEALAEHFSVTRALAHCGVADYTRKLTRLTARLPSPEQARHLRQPATRPILQAESINIDAKGRPIQYTIARFAGDRVQMVVEN